MKRIDILLAAAFLLLGSSLIGQEFSFNLVFQDAIGNTDTLILGYDPNASDSVDNDEENIIMTKIDSVFDVRVTDELNARKWMNNSGGSFHLKKQIVEPNYGTSSWPEPIIYIDIKCKNWPVTASWDNSQFNEISRNKSLFTSIEPGGWWDVLSPSDLGRVELKDRNHVTFSANNNEYVSENFATSAYINDDSDTISVFWLAFAGSSISSAEKNNNSIENGLILFPNPVVDKIQITGVFSNQIAQIEIFDLAGRSIKNISDPANIDLSDLQNGMYFINVKLNDNSLVIKKIIKE